MVRVVQLNPLVQIVHPKCDIFNALNTNFDYKRIDAMPESTSSQSKIYSMLLARKGPLGPRAVDW